MPEPKNPIPLTLGSPETTLKRTYYSRRKERKGECAPKFVPVPEWSEATSCLGGTGLFVWLGGACQPAGLE